MPSTAATLPLSSAGGEKNVNSDSWYKNSQGRGKRCPSTPIITPLQQYPTFSTWVGYCQNREMNVWKLSQIYVMQERNGTNFLGFWAER